MKRMRKRKFIAFYDLLAYLIICGSLFVCGIVCFIAILCADAVDFTQWALEHWYYVLSVALGVAIPAATVILIKSCVFFDSGAVYFRYFPFTISWEKAANGIDPNWNQTVYITEISEIEIVKLSKKEKKMLTSTKFIFNKFLRIKLRSGKEKYVYVATYAPWQVKKICELLLKDS